MGKNPHAVALGRLGGRAGGRQGGLARAAALTAERRREIARTGATARWRSDQPGRSGPLEIPEAVARLLKPYDVSRLRWDHPSDRWAIASEILVRGSAEARAWLDRLLSLRQLRQLARRFRGAGLNEPGRAKIRVELSLSEDDIPRRAFLGFSWGEAKKK
jgi:hypothetical protein